MAIGEICNRDVVVIDRGATVKEAAHLMREFHVGDLVVLRERSGVKEPVGILTDRDIVIEVLGEDVNIDAVTVGDIMSNKLLIAREEDDFWETLQRMRIAGVRRLPVVDKHGALQGIVSLDDIIELLSEELAQVSKLLAREQSMERATRSRG